MGKKAKAFGKIKCYSCTSYGGPASNDFCEKGRVQIYLTKAAKHCQDFEQFIFKKDNNKKLKIKILSNDAYYCEVYK